MFQHNRLAIGVSFTLALVGAGPVRAQSVGDADTCLAALTVAGRNQVLQVKLEDREAFAYKAVCENSSTNHSLDTNFLMANDFINGSSRGKYGSTREYCEAEKSKYSNYSFDFTATSTVLESALKNWLSCRELTAEQIRVKPVVLKESANISFARGATPSKGQILGVTATAGTTCSGFVATPSGALERKAFGPNDVVTLPSDVWFTLECARQSRSSTSLEGQAIYPRSVITVGTTVRPFVLVLDEEPVATETWASDIRASIQALRDQMEKRIAEKLDKDKMPDGDYAFLAGDAGCPAGFVEVDAMLRAIASYDENTAKNYLHAAKFGKSSLTCHDPKFCGENGPRQRPSGVSNAAFLGDLNLAVCVRQPPK